MDFDRQYSLSLSFSLFINNMTPKMYFSADPQISFEPFTAFCCMSADAPHYTYNT